MALTITKRQTEVLQFIKTWVETHGTAPTRREIADQFGFSSANAAQCHLVGMAKRGMIRLVPRTSRGIRVVG